MKERVEKLERDYETMKQDLSAIRSDVAGLKATFEHTLPHLATKAGVADIPHLATKAELETAKSELIKWLVGTMLASASLAAAIAFGLARLLGGSA